MKMQRAQGMPDRWQRFYETVAQATPAQVQAAIEATGPMQSDGAGKRQLAQALGLEWCLPCNEQEGRMQE